MVYLIKLIALKIILVNRCCYLWLEFPYFWRKKDCSLKFILKCPLSISPYLTKNARYYLCIYMAGTHLACSLLICPQSCLIGSVFPILWAIWLAEGLGTSRRPPPQAGLQSQAFPAPRSFSSVNFWALTRTRFLTSFWFPFPSPPLLPTSFFKAPQATGVLFKAGEQSWVHPRK